MVYIFKKKLLHLLHSNVTTKQIYNLLQIDPLLTHLYDTPIQYLQHYLQLSEKQKKNFPTHFSSMNIDQIINLYNSHNIQFITILDPEYPPLLKEIYQPPLGLFILGNKELLSQKILAIVGARDADGLGKDVLNKLLPPLIDRQLVIVSGLAKGADTFAHEKTIQLGGKTIAVLGSGFYHIYPRENMKLAKIIAMDHCLVSEYPPIKRPEKWHFPMRNRIIAGLSLGVLVLQAKRRSGSLITADFALDAGREVFAIPGPIQHKLFEGTNRLIQQGAKLVMNAQDILEELQV